MASSWRNIRVVFLLQVAIVCLVVVLCMLGLDAANGEVVQPVTIAAIGIALLAIAAVTWMTYRATKRLLAPMDWLLREVARWDPQRPDTRALAPERIPYAVQGEVRMMADALHGLGERMDAYIARERDFTRDASHELRTPLTVIRVAADLIARDAALSERSRRSLGRIQGANAAMESLMDALLMLARDEDVALETEDFAVRDIVAHELERPRRGILALRAHALGRAEAYRPAAFIARGGITEHIVREKGELLCPVAGLEGLRHELRAALPRRGHEAAAGRAGERVYLARALERVHRQADGELHALFEQLQEHRVLLRREIYKAVHIDARFFVHIARAYLPGENGEPVRGVGAAVGDDGVVGFGYQGQVVELVPERAAAGRPGLGEPVRADAGRLQLVHGREQQRLHLRLALRRGIDPQP